MVRRFASSILLLSLLHVLLPARSASVHEMADMSGMGMGGSQHSDIPADHGPMKDGCRYPWSPGCPFASACAPLAVLVSPTVVEAVGQREAPPATAVVSEPESAEGSPDHPPPRR